MAANNGSTTLEFRDRNGNARRLTIRSLPAGVVQVLEGLVNSAPSAEWISITLSEKEPCLWTGSGTASVKLRLQHRDVTSTE
jgi:hypothetical protein